MSPDELLQWVAATERCLVTGHRSVAAGAWHCEGRWQHDDQMDIWQCLDEAELDRRRAAGLDPDPDDETETDEQD